MARSYVQINPTETLRPILLDPSQPIADGLAFPQIIGKGQTINVGPRNRKGGLLSGTLRSRDPRNIKSAAVGQSVRTAIGAPRETSERWPDIETDFKIYKVSGAAEALKKDLECDLDPEVEQSHFEQAMASVWIKKELWCADFFLSKAADTFNVDGFTVPGWGTLDWAGSYTALGASYYTFLADLQASLAAKRKVADGKKFDTCYCDQDLMDKLQRDASVLGRFIKDNGTSGIAIVNGDQVAPDGFVRDVFKQHFGLRMVCGSAVHSNQRKDTTESNTYIGRSGRMWIGCAGDMGVSGVGGTEPRVYRTNSAFACLEHDLETDSGYTEPVAPTSVLFAVDAYMDLVAIDATFGFTIYGL